MASLFPVIMCGGAGTRLWPASRPSRPKPFVPLARGRSLFQDTVERVAPLAEGCGELLIVGGIAHRRLILDQLEQIDVSATLLLEPEGRDSAAAMAAAAWWTKARDIHAVNLFVASDHHVPDARAFRQAVQDVRFAAENGRIVTLGTIPTEPSSAYGYIAPRSPGMSDVAAFVEKPERHAALAYIKAGYLWNSGNFIVRADVLAEEIVRHSAAVGEAVVAALEEARTEGRCVYLGPRFAAAPKISIDHAVMEKTERASVLPVSFSWSDLGAWDSIAASGEGDTGTRVLKDVHDCLIRAVDGVVVAAMGIRDLAIVVERDAVLVCSLERSQDVSELVRRLRVVAPEHVDFPSPATPALAVLADRFADWMRLRALPIWTAYGQDEDGGFVEALTIRGQAVNSHRSFRVQARQIQVFAAVADKAKCGRWTSQAIDGLSYLRRTYLQADGTIGVRVGSQGKRRNPATILHDQALFLVALAAVWRVAKGPHREQADAVREHILSSGHTTGPLIDLDDHFDQPRACMCLLEASLAWEEATDDPAWRSLSDRVASWAVSHFLDRLSEASHQLELVWLLARYSRVRSSNRFKDVAENLYQIGLARINIQSRERPWLYEWVALFKSALVLFDYDPINKQDYLGDVKAALKGIEPCLTHDGLWRDNPSDDGATAIASASMLHDLFTGWGLLATIGPAQALMSEDMFRLGRRVDGWPWTMQ